jgi:hypothetical protein
LDVLDIDRFMVVDLQQRLERLYDELIFGGSYSLSWYKVPVLPNRRKEKEKETKGNPAPAENLKYSRLPKLSLKTSLLYAGVKEWYKDHKQLCMIYL